MIINAETLPEEELVWTGSLFRWFELNSDGFSELEKEVVVRELTEKGVYSEGVGACVGFRLRLV